MPGDLVLVVADEYRTGLHGARPAPRRRWAAARSAEGPHRYVWVVDFPMFDGVDADGPPAGRPTTPSPCPIPTTSPLLATDPLRCAPRPTTWSSTGGSSARAASGSTAATSRRRSSPRSGISDEEAEARFGFLLGAFRYGAPPHAGFAVGIDRLVAIFAGEENIREVIAFPKTQSGADPMTGAPTPLPAASLAELGIRVAVPPATTRTTEP